MGEGAKVSEFFSQKNPNLREKKTEGVGRRGWGVMGGRWMDGRTGPNQFAPSTSSKLGA